MKKHRPLPPLENLREAFFYNPATGELRWKVGRCGRAGALGIAGTVNSRGYRNVLLHGERWLVHRIAWLMHYGADPGEMLIDHINGDKLDNKISNLRLATKSQNNANLARLRKNNKSGVHGVRWDNSIGRWTAYIGGSKKNRVHLGVFKNKEEAVLARAAAQEAAYGDFVPAWSKSN